MNESDYTSHPVAQQLAEAGILFPESGRVWFYNISKRPVRWKLGTLKEALFCHDLSIQGYEKFGSSFIFPAPSTMEIMSRLPGYAIFQIDNKWICGKISITNGYYMITGFPIKSTESSAAADAAAEMLRKIEKE